MLDLPVLYFLLGLALVLSILRKADLSSKDITVISILAAVDLSAYLGQKAFAAIYLGALILAFEAGSRLLWRESLLPVIARARWRWVILALGFIWLPSVLRAAYYTGDPFFPLFPQLTRSFCNTTVLGGDGCLKLLEVAQSHRSAVSQYGYGHGFIDFIRSLLIVPLSWDGPSPVNNRFDYPLGFVWFALWGGLALASVRGSRLVRRWGRLGLLVGFGFYLVWFAGSQQSRWLYPNLLVGAVVASMILATLGVRLQRVVLACLVICISINGVRVIRSQRSTLGCIGSQCLQYEPIYARDYARYCSSGEVELIASNGIRGRAYLDCRTAGSR